MSHWVQLENAPKGIRYGNAINLNDDEFIIATSMDHESKKNGFVAGIYRYKQYHKHWKLLIPYSKHTKKQNLKRMTGHAIAFDEMSKKIYLYSNQAQMIIIDMKYHEIDIIKTSMDRCGLPCLVNANSTIHLIGGINNSQHLIWNPDSKKFEQIYDFNSDFKGASLLFIPSKQILLLIGGKDNYIYIYSLHSKRWNILKNIQFKIMYPQTILYQSYDQHYVIIFGGFTDKIYVLYIGENDEYKLVRSTIISPKSGMDQHVIKIGGGLMDQMLVFGYFKEVMNRLELNDIELPSVIVNLIIRWYGAEKLHWIEYNDGISEKQHFAIPIYNIITCVKNRSR